MKKQLNIKITGSVQGVFYRTNAQEQAQKLGITGWVKNDQDGGVSICAQGEEKTLNSLIEWCKEGPPGAKVTNIETTSEENPARIFTTFEIKN